MNRKHNFSWTLFFSLSFFCQVLFAGDMNFDPQSTSSLSKKKSDKLDKIVLSSLENYDASAMVLGVWDRNKKLTYTKGAGYSDILKRKQVNFTDSFRIGSITKTFTTTALLQIIEEDQGKNITLDTPLSKFFPEIKDSEKIPIWMLLNMTSGIYNYTENFDFSIDVANDRKKTWNPSELLSEYVLKKNNQLYFKPGTAIHYSNTNTNLAGMIVEKLTQKKLRDVIQEKILNPLSLKETSFPENEKVGGAFIHGFTDDLADVTLNNPTWGWAAGAMISNLTDLSVYIEALATGKLIGPKMHKKRLEQCFPLDNKTPANKYCLGVFVVDGFIGHNGGLSGYTSFAAHHPTKNETIVFMFNNHPGTCCGNTTFKIFKEILAVLEDH